MFKTIILLSIFSISLFANRLYVGVGNSTGIGYFSFEKDEDLSGDISFVQSDFILKMGFLLSLNQRLELHYSRYNHIFSDNVKKIYYEQKTHKLIGYDINYIYTFSNYNVHDTSRFYLRASVGYYNFDGSAVAFEDKASDLYGISYLLGFGWFYNLSRFYELELGINTHIIRWESYNYTHNLDKFINTSSSDLSLYFGFNYNF